MRKLFGWISCRVFGAHDWTCKAKEGIDPSEDEKPVPGDGLETARRFWIYARMYCKRCGYVYVPRG